MRAVTVAVGEAGPTIRIVVTDDGPGVAVADRERIFERFSRANGARARSDGERGLGLAIVRDILAAHGGSIGVTDSANGAAFTIELPGL